MASACQVPRIPDTRGADSLVVDSNRVRRDSPYPTNPTGRPVAWTGVSVGRLLHGLSLLQDADGVAERIP
jgi:hypothetical protein